MVGSQLNFNFTTMAWTTFLLSSNVRILVLLAEDITYDLSPLTIQPNLYLMTWTIKKAKKEQEIVIVLFFFFYPRFKTMQPISFSFIFFQFSLFKN